MPTYYRRCVIREGPPPSVLIWALRFAPLATSSRLSSENQRAVARPGERRRRETWKQGAEDAAVMRPLTCLPGGPGRREVCSDNRAPSRAAIASISSRAKSILSALRPVKVSSRGGLGLGAPRARPRIA